MKLIRGRFSVRTRSNGIRVRVNNKFSLNRCLRTLIRKNAICFRSHIKHFLLAENCVVMFGKSIQDKTDVLFLAVHVHNMNAIVVAFFQSDRLWHEAFVGVHDHDVLSRFYRLKHLAQNIRRLIFLDTRRQTVFVLHAIEIDLATRKIDFPCKVPMKRSKEVTQP